MTICSALLISGSDLDAIGQSKARSYKSGGPLVAVVEGNKFAVVQGYKVGKSIADCLATCIRNRDLSGHAKACYEGISDY